MAMQGFVRSPNLQRCTRHTTPLPPVCALRSVCKPGHGEHRKEFCFGQTHVERETPDVECIERPDVVHTGVVGEPELIAGRVDRAANLWRAAQALAHRVRDRSHPFAEFSLENLP